MIEWGTGYKSAFRDLCSVLCVFLSLLFVLPLGFCFSGFSHLPCSFLRQRESSSVRAGQWDAAGQAPRRGLLSLWLCNTDHLGTISGEKKALMDKPPVGQVRRPAWRVPVASRLECLCRTGRFKGSPCCASCGVSVKLWSTGMCSVGEENCNKKYFSQKSPFFQTLSRELPKWICKWLPASK